MVVPIFVVLLLIVSVITYRIGIKVTTDAYANELNKTQAMLAFNHLLRYEELLKCLDNQESDSAAQKIRMSIISEKELISEYLASNNSEQLSKYISIRYDYPIDELINYKSNRGSRWSEPSCM